MIAKLIVKGRDRTEAIGRMKRALEMFVIEGIKKRRSRCTAGSHRSGFCRGEFRYPLHRKIARNERKINVEAPCSTAAVCDIRRSIANRSRNRVRPKLADAGCPVAAIPKQAGIPRELFESSRELVSLLAPLKVSWCE